MPRAAFSLALCCAVAAPLLATPLGAESPPVLARAANRAFPRLDREREGAWKGPFFFVQLSDPQFGFFEGDRTWERETALFTRAIEHVNRLHPKFVVVTGDLVNQGPGGPAHAAQVAEFQRIAGKLDPSIPLICVAGNHDVGNRPTAATLAAYRAEFGEDWFGFWAGGVRCLVLNSSLYFDPHDVETEEKEQNAWFARELETARRDGAKQILVFQHHPWFIAQQDEPDQYFNIPRERREPALALMRAAGVRAVFAGHLHHNAEARVGDLQLIATGPVGKPLGKDPSGLRIVRVYADHLEHAYYPMDAVPDHATLD